jgi:hypothetical protein
VLETGTGCPGDEAGADLGEKAIVNCVGVIVSFCVASEGVMDGDIVKNEEEESEVC